MNPSRHALIVGKFYPPHRGHHLLVDTAAAMCGRVSVVVMASTRETIALQRRVAWMRQAHVQWPGVQVAGIMDDVPVDYGDPGIWDQHEALMREALASLAAPAVTHVFSSEPYGHELARRFSAQAVVLDPGRGLVPVSATQVRADVPAHWSCLHSAVRTGLAARIVVLGSESSGTTTLARTLAERWQRRGGAHAQTRWVPEHGRDYTVAKLALATAQAQVDGRAAPGMEGLHWTSDEFEQIARQQQHDEDQAAGMGGPVLFCDTDALATAVWHERYVGSWRDDLLDLRRAVPAVLHLLTHHEDVPFEQDGLRDGEHRRAWMTQRFIEVLEQNRLPYRVLRGNPEERADEASRWVDLALGRHWHFAHPLQEGER